MTDKNNVLWGDNSGLNPGHTPAKHKKPSKPKRMPINNDKPRPTPKADTQNYPDGLTPADYAKTGE